MTLANAMASQSQQYVCASRRFKVGAEAAAVSCLPDRIEWDGDPSKRKPTDTNKATSVEESRGASDQGPISPIWDRKYNTDHVA